MLARFFLSVLALSSVLLGVSAQDPPTYCSPVTIDAFQVVVASSQDTEGATLGHAQGTFGVDEFYIPLASNYPGPKVFFNVKLTPNATVAEEVGVIAYGFTIQLNGQYHPNINNDSTFFSVGEAGEVDNIEFSNWLSNVRAPLNNTLYLNVSEYYIVNPGTLTPAGGSCFHGYTITFNNPIQQASTGAFVAGDPQFKGLRGQSFQVHGVDGAVYNLISDANMQLNTRFTFLEGPRPCPVMPSTGKVSAACWSHPGSYLSELALKTSGDSQLSVVSGEASQGFSSVQLNGKTLAVGASSALSFTDSDATGSVTVDSTHELTIRSGLFEVVVENNDGFVNLRSVYVSAANWPKLAAHGLLGQTWQNKRYGGKIKEIEGDVDDYLIEDDNMFGDSFLFNQFSA